MNILWQKLQGLRHITTRTDIMILARDMNIRLGRQDSNEGQFGYPVGVDSG